MPLAYTPNSPIPLHLTISCVDSMGFDLLSTPTAFTRAVTATRVVSTGQEADRDVSSQCNNLSTEEVARASFWPSSEVSYENGVRSFHGEIQLPTGLKPSFVFPNISLRYYVNFHVPSATGFTYISPGGSNQPALSQEIRIVTHNAPGFIPRSQVPGPSALADGVRGIPSRTDWTDAETMYRSVFKDFFA